ALALLCTHLAYERVRPVDASVPLTHWIGPQTLRAHAQYLRCPLVGIDMVMRISKSMRTRILISQATWKEASTTTKAGFTRPSRTLQLQNTYNCVDVSMYCPFSWSVKCTRNTSTEYNTENFFSVARRRRHGICRDMNGQPIWSTPPAGIEVVTVSTARPREPGFTVTYNGTELDLSDDTETTNELLHTAITMRQRLDVVHYRLGWPILDGVEYQQDIMDSLMEEAELQIYEAAGIDGYATGTRITSYNLSPPPQPRSTVPMRNRLHSAAYQAVLQANSQEELTPAYTRELEMTESLNRKALEQWYRAERATNGIPRMFLLDVSVPMIMTTMDSVQAVRHLFAHLPYPEFAVKQTAMDRILQWGQLEAFTAQRDAVAVRSSTW
ncbi:hypothetical protein PHMEG_00033160, partial [Phytophthora megakarya]